LGRKIGDAPHPHLAVGGKLPGECEFRRVLWQTVDANRLDDPLWERLAKSPKIGLNRLRKNAALAAVFRASGV
jgi:hypothetical protein